MDEGARAATGGARITDGDLARGYFVAPTLLVDVKDDMRVMQEEIFRPVGCVSPFDDTDEVICRANNTTYGLAGGFWTRDVKKAHHVVGTESLDAYFNTKSVWIRTAD